jgi:hypothetical protein
VKRLAYPRLDLSLWLRVLLSRVRGAREFRNAVRAHARGAPVVEPLAFGVAVRPRRGYESLWSTASWRKPLASRRFTRSGRSPCGDLAAAKRRPFHERGVFLTNP